MSIILDHINYCYSADSAYKVQALKDVSLEINDGEFIGIIGHTGSGKSTLIQHMNGLLKATSGHIYYNGQDIYDNDYDLSKLRHKVGMVFQYPEHQVQEQYGRTTLPHRKLLMDILRASWTIILRYMSLMRTCICQYLQHIRGMG